MNVTQWPQWWSRYMWAEGLRLSSSARQRMLGWSHLNILSVSALATDTEKDIILMLALLATEDDNTPNPKTFYLGGENGYTDYPVYGRN